MPRKRAPKKKNMYFTQVHEDAIVKYCSTDDMRIKEDLYMSLIRPAFSQMVDKIVFTYRFTNLPDIEDLRDECKGWLVTILAKFDPNKGSKAFSYFSVVTKNWFIHKVKKNKKRLEREVSFEAVDYDLERDLMDKGESFQDKKVRKELMKNLRAEMESWEPDFTKEAERKVYDAVIVLFDSADDIEIFNKKAIYLYLREITGMNTKQVVTQLNKMRKRYREFRDDWDDGKI
jgi:DNA-directed RNA polymerase specialized sigma subunit